MTSKMNKSNSGGSAKIRHISPIDGATECEGKSVFMERFSEAFAEEKGISVASATRIWATAGEPGPDANQCPKGPSVPSVVKGRTVSDANFTMIPSAKSPPRKGKGG